MEEEMIALHNIMPVELAIKRELEYRKKMEASRNQCQSDLKPLVTQVAVSGSQTTVERKRKVQPCNVQCSRTLLSSTSCQRSTGFICVVCRMGFTTVFHLTMHGETFAHKSKVYQSRKRGQNVSNPFVCELCDASCSTGRVMEFHVAGLKHAACFQEFEDA